ncbi:MAG: MlaD family protein [Thermodesulfobacteriota bacterium]
MTARRSSIFLFSPEAKVGIFVLVGIALLVFMSLKVGGFRFGKAEGYTLFATFDSAAGIDPNASVKIAGVEVGRVTEISLIGNRARIAIRMRPEVRIGTGFTATLKSTGLLGEKYLELVPGPATGEPLKEGDDIVRTAKYMDMENLMTSLSDLSGELKEITSSIGGAMQGANGESAFKNIVTNLEEITTSVNAVVSRNDRKLENIISNIDRLTTTLNKDAPEISEGLRESIKNLNIVLSETGQSLSDLLGENRENVRESVENLRAASEKLNEAMTRIDSVMKEAGTGMESLGSIAKKIDRGEGTMGKLINDKKMGEDLGKTISGISGYLKRTEDTHIYLNYRGEYLIDEADLKSFFSVKIEPRKNHYYLFEVIDDPRGRISERRSTTIVGTQRLTNTETVIEDKLLFTAELARGFGPLVLRGGLIESEAGIGVDLNLLKERLKFSFEAFNFNQTGNPHLKVGATFFLNKYFYVTGGADDFISKIGLGSSFVGMGLNFRDDDIKLLLTSVPKISFN